MAAGNQFGVDQDDNTDDGDDDLEAELAALTVGITKKPKRGHLQIIFGLLEIFLYFICVGRKQVVSEQELNKMVAHSLKDIPSDAEISDIDDDEVEVISTKILNNRRVQNISFLLG